MTVLYAGPLPLVVATPVSVVIGGAVVGALSGNSFQILKETLVGTVLGLVAGVVGIAAFAAYSAVAVGVSPGTILAMAVTLGGGGALLVYPLSYPLAVLAAKFADRSDPDLGADPSRRGERRSARAVATGRRAV